MPVDTTLGRRVGDRSVCFVKDNVVFTRGAAVHLPDKPIVPFYDTHGRKGGDSILRCRHNTANVSNVNRHIRSTLYLSLVT